MSTRKLKTIQLSGKDYAQVSERVRAIHEDYKGDKKGQFSLTTKYSLEEGVAIFTATIMICAGGVPARFTGHSYGKVGQKAKDFEKLESIAVGRALAFAGYLADGEIASADEMEEYKNDVDQDALAKAVSSIKDAKTVPALNKAYTDMPLALKQHKDVLEAGKKRKKELTAKKK